MGGFVKEHFEKIKRYCAYQERSHFEVKKKLNSFGLSAASAEVLLAKLIEENYLDDERFARSFVRGKFGLKSWGRKKIEYELAQKKVNISSIKASLKEINEADYLLALQKLATERWACLAEEPPLTRQAKTTHYLLQKGYEMPLIQQCLKAFKEKG